MIKRNSIKKASNFKVQSMRNRFKTYLDQVENSEVVRKYPSLYETVKETSELVNSYCYSYADDCPFNMGMNYGSRYFGFSNSENITTYREWLPDVAQVYLLGEFNQFDKTQHPLLPEDKQKHWYTVKIDTNQHRLDEGSKLMLRIIDHQGTEFYMIPPSCHIVDGKYGIYQQMEKFTIKSKAKTSTLLAYTFDAAKMPLSKFVEFVDKEKQALSYFNTIIIKNLFSKNSSLLNRYCLSKSQMEELRDLILKLKDQLAVKILIEWSFDHSPFQEKEGPIERGYLQQVGDSYEFKVANPEVLAFYLSQISYYYYAVGIDGIHFTNVDKVIRSKAGIVLVKCINTIKERISDEGLTLGSSRDQVPGLLEPIIQGGLGFTFSYGYKEDLFLTLNHQELIDKFARIHQSSNCLALNYDNYSEDHSLNIKFAYLMSNRGVLCSGNFEHIRQTLRRILKLRKQEQFFEEAAVIDKIDSKSITARRGSTLILFNFETEPIRFEIKNIHQYETIYQSNEDEVQVEEGTVIVSGRNCVLFELKESSQQ